MQLKTYQEDAIDDLLDKAKKLLNIADGKKLVFKAPTGSGKTIMMAEFQIFGEHRVRDRLRIGRGSEQAAAQDVAGVDRDLAGYAGRLIGLKGKVAGPQGHAGALV